MLSSSDSSIRPARLRCERFHNPLGIDAPRPRLSWQFDAVRENERGQRQIAYQILAGSDPEALKKGRGDLWDSGRVESADSLSIRYGGKPHSTGDRVYWKVRVWDEKDRASAYSEAAWFEAAVMKPEEWEGGWIASDRPLPETDAAFYDEHPAPLFRKGFKVKGEIKRARAYVSGLGYYELRLNGEKVGDRLLDPAWTTYSKRVFYAAYDVTDRIKQGENAVGIMVGNGWRNPLPIRMFGQFNFRDFLPVGKPGCILQLNVEYEDGSKESVVTDESWRVGDGPILKNNVYLGELYDARQEQDGWDSPGFDDSSWAKAVRAADPVGPLQAQPLPPIRAARTLKPVRIAEPQPGVYLFDFDQNFAGRIALYAEGPAGTRIRLRYAELLNEDGTLNVMTSVTGQIKGGNGGPGCPPVAWQGGEFVLKGKGRERYEPRFTFHGFRYVEVTGYPGKPTLSDLEGHLLHTDVESAGEFSCSNEMLTRLQEVVRWTLLSNMFSVQSDCPHREKLGYGGDVVATTEMAMLNFDMAQFYEKAARDFADAARPNGGITETAPYVGIASDGLGEGSGPVGWGTAFPLLQWHLHQYYGARDLMEEQYEATKRWTEFLISKAKDGILDNGISDHESLVPKPVALTGTAFYYYNVRLMARIAGALGRAEDERKYRELSEGIKEAFNRRFLKGNGVYDIGTQCCQSFALYFDLVPEEKRAAALEALTKDIMETHGGHVSGGIFSTKYMLNALTDAGRAEVAYQVASKKTFPGWGYMLENGATTLWESWAWDPAIRSHNHPMFGSVSEWLFKALAGIRPDPAAVGFDKIIIRPEPVDGLTWAKGSYRSVRGEIRSEWKREGDALALDVTIPPNATATVYVPVTSAASVREGGRPAVEADGVKYLGTEGGAAAFAVQPGRYRFTATP